MIMDSPYRGSLCRFYRERFTVITTTTLRNVDVVVTVCSTSRRGQRGDLDLYRSSDSCTTSQYCLSSVNPFGA